MRLQAWRQPAWRSAVLAAAWSLAGAAVGTAQHQAPAPALCKPPAPLLDDLSDLKLLADFPPPRADARGYDVLAYDLELRLDPGARSITGQVTIRLAAAPTLVSAKLDTVVLDLVPELTLTAAADRQGALAAAHEGSRLAIALRTALPAGALDTLTLNWTGRPPRHGSFLAGLMFRTHDPGTPTDRSDDVPIVANLSQTWSAHSWWPCKDHPSDKALVSLAVTVPDTLSAVSNGSLEGVTALEAGWRRYAWREAYPLPTYLVSVAVSNYDQWSEDCRPGVGPPVRLEYHVFPEDRAPAERDLAATCDMMSFLTDRIGPWPYPGEKYAQVEFKWIGAMEHTTATSLAQLLFTGDGRHENLFLHEMAHQWFGDSLTPARWADIWLSEGFARYCEALWVEHRYGPAAYDDFMATIGPRRHPDLFAGEGTLADPIPILPNTLVYDKGAWVLHMLRLLEGDEVFFRFLRDYAGDLRLQHGLVTVEDLIAAAESAAGRSLSGFFAPWLQTDRVPAIHHAVTRLQPDAVRVTLTQVETPWFEVPVPVVLHTACGDRREVARLTAARQSFRWEATCAIDSVTVAPRDLSLVRGTTSLPLALEVFGPNPNPAGAAGTSFMFFLRETSHVTVNTYNARGLRVASSDLGSQAVTGPSELPIAPGHPWRWQPTTPTGASLPAGLYYVEFLGGSGRQVKPVVLVH